MTDLRDLLTRSRIPRTVFAGVGENRDRIRSIENRSVPEASIPLPILQYVEFTPSGDFVEITSTDPDNPTMVQDGLPITFDGATQVKIEFYAATIDLDQRTKSGQAAVFLELYDGSTALGVIADYNAGAGNYFTAACYVAAFDLPAAGSHTYSIRGYKQVSGGTLGKSFVYGTAITTPHATRVGFFTVLLATI